MVYCCVGFGVPGGSVRGDVCELAGLDMAEIEVVFKVVFDALFGSACLMVPLLLLAKEDPSSETMLGHPDGVAGPSELCLNDLSFNSGAVRFLQYLQVGHHVLPLDTHYRSQRLCMECLQLFDLETLQVPSFTAIQQSCDNYCIVDFHICGKCDDLVSCSSASQ